MKIKNILNKSKNLFLNNISDEKENLVLWIPVLLGLGVYSYFLLKEKISIYFSFSLFLFFLLLTVLLRKKGQKILLILPFLFFSIGFFRANIFTIQQNSQKINSTIKRAYITGRIDGISFYNKYNIKKRVVIEIFEIDGLDKKDTPKKIRLNVKNENMKAKAGDTVRFTAKLTTLPSPVYPNAYDFSEVAYFEQIGATGYLIGDFEIIKSEDYTLEESTNNLRNTITNKISKAIKQPESGVAIALLVGERGLIEEEHLQNMQNSGLAHLIAISGLHIALVTFLFFNFTRFLLSRNEQITLNYNIKKISAIVALIVGFLYLAITGMPVSAKRAYIMIALLFIAILVDREATTVRSLAFAAIIIILFNPYMISSPGFQMSFAAVLGLITGFGMLSQYGVNLHGNTKFTKFILYLVGIMIGTITTEIFVSPIGIFHFNNYSPYNMISNLVAIPLTTFLVMPMGILSFPLMPAGLEKIALTPMAIGIKIILKISAETVSWENSVFMISQLPPISMFFFFIGITWISLWKRIWRFLGLLPIFIGIICIILNKNPDIIIDRDGKFFAIFNHSNKQLYFSKEPQSDFEKDIIMKKNGQKEFRLISEFDNNKPAEETNGLTFKCYKNFCFYKKYKSSFYFITKNYDLSNISFNKNSKIVDVTYKGINKEYINCDGCEIIDKKSLEKTGTVLFYINKNSINIKKII